MADASPEAPAPRIFDRALYRRRRIRAARRAPDLDFLHGRVAEDIVDRLESVARDFPRAAILGDWGGDIAARATPRCGLGEVFHDAPALAQDQNQHQIGDLSWVRIVCDEEAPPFAPGSLDLIVSFLALHAVNDLPGALTQFRRALKPDGLFIGAMFGGRTLSELRDALARAEAEIAGGVSPRVSPMLDIRDAGALLQRAGFALPVVDIDRMSIAYRHPMRLMADLRAMGETNALVARRPGLAPRALFARMCDIYTERYGRGDALGGGVSATFEIVTLTGWAPHESQQKPLAPGTAETGLAEAVLAPKPPRSE